MAQPAAGRQLLLAVRARHQDRVRQRPLHLRAQARDGNGRAGSAPGTPPVVGVTKPVLVADERGLVREPAVGVVEVMARKGAGVGDPALGRTIGADGQAERGPGERSAQPPERGVGNGPRHRDARVAAGRLRERHAVVADGRLFDELGQGHPGERHAARPAPHPRRAEPPATGHLVVDDPLSLYLDAPRQFVGEPDGVPREESIDVRRRVGRRSVVVGDARRERQLEQALDRLGRDPRQALGRCSDAQCSAPPSPASRRGRGQRGRRRS
jgi:hypothetical protein